jgi:hypothetical protein
VATFRLVRSTIQANPPATIAMTSNARLRTPAAVAVVPPKRRVTRTASAFKDAQRFNRSRPKQSRFRGLREWLDCNAEHSGEGGITSLPKKMSRGTCGDVKDLETYWRHK